MNRLAAEPSLYLRQHATNPVDWYPWGDEAWARAKAEDKPVLVSIGYSACHWCHVMAHECFEDEFIADLMNSHFICIKVDREERPDVDQIYMEAVQMLTQHGGWPLNAFCFPDGRPFFGGTYFPPADNNRGQVPWPQLLMRVSDYFTKNRAALAENAENIVKNLLISNVPPGTEGNIAWDNRALVVAARSIATFHDDTWGGFGGAPKFPPAMSLNFLLAVRASAAVEHTPGLAERLDKIVNITARAMAHGGLFDQFGGGFCRYSVDGQWLIPHFEKMLYDNALLLDFYAKAHRRFQNPLYAAVCEETVGWLLREMQHSSGAFYAALDADSDGHEGAAYVWTPAQLREVLGEDGASAIAAAYNITEAGNFEHGTSNPALVENDFAVRQQLAPLRAQLLAARSARTQPGRDSKISLAWNALLIRGLAEAAFAFGRKDWFSIAQKCADWLWKNLSFAGSDGTRRLHAVYYEAGGSANAKSETGTPKPETHNSKPTIGFLDDYAFFAEALLTLAAYADWAEPGSALLEQNVGHARALVDSARAHFRDPRQLGYFFTADDHEKLAVRKKEWWDNALPSGHASLAHALTGLHALTGENAYATELADLKKCYVGL
ncbi:MAG TPA: thioredoxin domain-containing protein, partial [Opitutales bacterium]|nr:thioredoxin domain-containing protein [Opitutales bacterium]